MKIQNIIFISLFIGVTPISAMHDADAIEKTLSIVDDLILARNNYSGCTSEEVPPLLSDLCASLSTMNINSTDEKGNSLLHSLYKKNDLCEILEEAHPTDLTLVMPFIKKGINPNIKNQKGDTPLHILLKKTTVPLFALHNIKLLLERGADITTVNNKNETLLHCIMQPWDNNILLSKPFFNTVLFLIGYISPNYKDNTGKTPLHKFMKYIQDVSESNKADLYINRAKYMILLFMSAGVPIDAQDNEGNSPLYYITEKPILFSHITQLLNELKSQK